MHNIVVIGKEGESQALSDLSIEEVEAICARAWSTIVAVYPHHSTCTCISCHILCEMMDTKSFVLKDFGFNHCTYWNAWLE